MKSSRYAVLSLRYGRPHMLTTHVGGGTNREYTENLQFVLDHGKAQLEKFLARPSFSGLYMSNIKDIAEAFRVDPRAHDPATISETIALPEILAPTKVNSEPQAKSVTGYFSAHPRRKTRTLPWTNSKGSTASVLDKYRFSAAPPRRVNPNVARDAGDSFKNTGKAAPLMATKRPQPIIPPIEKHTSDGDEFDCDDIEALLEAEKMSQPLRQTGQERLAASIEEIIPATPEEMIAEDKDEFDLVGAEAYFD